MMQVISNLSRHLSYILRGDHINLLDKTGVLATGTVAAEGTTCRHQPSFAAIGTAKLADSRKCLAVLCAAWQPCPDCDKLIVTMLRKLAFSHVESPFGIELARKIGIYENIRE